MSDHRPTTSYEALENLQLAVRALGNGIFGPVAALEHKLFARIVKFFKAKKGGELMGEEMRPQLTEQDKADAIENLEYQTTRFAFPLEIVAALDQHEPDYNNSRNLGYDRTFIECSCGAGWWFGIQPGDPSAKDEWSMHRARVVAEFLVEGEN
jgi:hypothetical protein